MTQEKKRLVEIIFDIINERLKIFKDEKLSSEATCSRIYQAIFNAVTEILTKSKLKLSNDAANYMAQQLYDAVTINEQIQLNPNIFTKRAKLTDLTTAELAIVGTMFSGDPLAIPVIQEIKKRS